MSRKKADGKGLRMDSGKTRVELIPADALLYLGRIYQYGAFKYSDRNWERGMKWSRVIAPLFRHLLQFMMGKKYDDCGEDCKEKKRKLCKFHSRLLHSAHIAWNGITLLTFEIRGIGEDDRDY